ncbi:MAG: AMP-binding protein [Gemmataceae bacterium]|nr:AMP-binding protein [Gemmataceae bacterium]
MLSYSHGAAGPALLGQTIGDNLRATVARCPANDALVVPWQKARLTYASLWEQVSLAARGLHARGVKPGDRVGIWSSNRAEWVVAQYATARLGAILVNINPAYRAHELAYVLKQSGVSLLLHADGFKGQPYAPLLDEARPACRLLHLDRDWTALLDQGRAVAEKDIESIEAGLSFDDPINIQYTSGTTGNPKGACLTHHNILNNAYLTGVALGYTEADRVCAPVPFYHCFGMVLANLACTSTGACLVAPSEWFDPAAALAAIQAERCTSLYGVPTMFRAILECPSFASTDVTSLRTGIMAGAPCPVELMKLVVSKLHMPEVAIGYGMTETSPLSTLSSRDDPLERRVGSVGRVLPHLEICVRDPETGRIVERGKKGEFCTRGYSVMVGYWEDEAATRSAIRGGWMRSGDVATMDEAGYVNIVGRIKDMIIRGGENISPREIEEVLLCHAAVSEAQVVGLPSAKYGEEVMAWIRRAPGASVAEAELAAHCKARLASYKVPRYWKLTDAFPMTVTGKIQKYRLRELAAEEFGRQADAAEETA